MKTKPKQDHVDRLSSNKPVLFCVIINLDGRGAEWHEFVRMTDDQARQVVAQLQLAKDKKAIHDYDVIFALDIFTSAKKYVAGIEAWVNKSIGDKKGVGR